MAPRLKQSGSKTNSVWYQRLSSLVSRLTQSGTKAAFCGERCVVSSPGSEDSETGQEKSIVQREEKGILQKLKEVFWKDDEEDDSKTRQKMS